MVERRPFDRLAREDLGWLVARSHRDFVAPGNLCAGVWSRMREWSEDEIAPSAGLPLQERVNVEIVVYVSEGAITHRDSLGNEGRIEAGSVQVVSAGTGIRHAEYNLEQSPARIFRILFAPDAPGGSPAWATQPCPAAVQPGGFAAIASGIEGDVDALPIRAGVRVLNAKLSVGQSAAHVLGVPRCAYLVPSTGIVIVNGVLIRARDGAAIADTDVVTITAIEDADIVMVDVAS
jgi:quercetin 2,3-dioxygenase